jgi:ribonuclease I
MEIKVIGFYGRDNNLFIYNSWDDRFDDWSKADLIDDAFKYQNTTMSEAQVCMQIEGNVGDLQELTLSY